MTKPLLGPDDGLGRRFEIAAPPAQARALMERAVTLTGGTLVASRAGGFDFAPRAGADRTRGSVDLAHCPGGTACLVRVGWPTNMLVRFVGTTVIAAAILLPLAALRGPGSFAVVLVALTVFGFGRYLVALGVARTTLRYLALVARSLANSTLYRAILPGSIIAETRRLIGDLCAGRIMPSDFSHARRLLLAGLA